MYSHTDHRIQVKEVLLDNTYISKVIGDKKLWFTKLEVLELICHRFFYTTNCLGWQPTAFQLFQTLTLQTVPLAPTAIHCVLSEYATWKKNIFLFVQNEYKGGFCAFTVIALTLNTAALII